MFVSRTQNFAAKEKLEIVGPFGSEILRVEDAAAPPPFRPPAGGFAGGIPRSDLASGRNAFVLIQEYCTKYRRFLCRSNSLRPGSVHQYFPGQFPRIVAGSHGVAICARIQDGEGIPDPAFWEEAVLGKKIARFAQVACDCDLPLFSARAGRVPDPVIGTVHGRPDQVIEAGIHSHEGPGGGFLYVRHGDEKRTRFRHWIPARLEHDAHLAAVFQFEFFHFSFRFPPK